MIAAAAWTQVLVLPMAMDDMAGMAMAMSPTLIEGAAYVAAWAIMMAGDDAPERAPDDQALRGHVAKRWALTGVPIYLASVGLSAVDTRTLAYAIAAVLVVAGLFQLSPLKQVCLRHCRSPLGFLLGHWREGWRGGLAMDGAHALYCLGCCWALMIVLVVAGAMGLIWVLLIAAVVAGEKLLPRGEWIARTTGLALVLLGVAVAVRPSLAAALRAGGHSM